MTRIPVESDAEFTLLLTSLTEDAVTASIHWRLYKDIRAAVPEFVRELNQSPAFWSLTLNAHRDVTLFRLGRLYDQQSAALSLRSLLDTIAANLHLFDQAPFKERLKENPFVQSLAEGARRPDDATLAQDVLAVSEKDQLVARLLALRNRVLAHRDPRVVLGTAADPVGVLDDKDIDALVARAGTTVNRYSILFRAASSFMKIVGEDDFRDVLERVRRDILACEKEIADEIARLQG